MDRRQGHRRDRAGRLLSMLEVPGPLESIAHWCIDEGNLLNPLCSSQSSSAQYSAMARASNDSASSRRGRKVSCGVLASYVCTNPESLPSRLLDLST